MTKNIFRYLGMIFTACSILFILGCKSGTNAAREREIDDELLLARLQLSHSLPASAYPNLVLGSGVDSLYGHDVGSCTTFDEKNADHKIVHPASGPTKVQAVLQQITDESQFLSTLNLSVSVSAQGWGSKANATYSRFQSETRSSYALHYLVGYLIEGPTVTMKDLPLRKDIAEYLAHGKLREFYNLCGTEFVKSYTQGASYLAIMDVKTTALASQLQQNASIKAEIGGWLSGDATYSSSVATKHTNGQLNLQMLYSGGAAQLNPDPASFVKNANTWKETIEQTAKQVQGTERFVPLRLFTSGYVYSSPVLPKYVVDKLSAHERASALHDDLNRSRADVNYVEHNQDEFHAEDRAAFLKHKQNLESLEKQIQQALNDCDLHQKDCARLLSLTIPQIPLPSRIDWQLIVPTDTNRHFIGSVLPHLDRKLVFRGMWSLWSVNGPYHPPGVYEDDPTNKKACPAAIGHACGIFVTFYREDGVQEGQEQRIDRNNQVAIPAVAVPLNIYYQIVDQNPGDNGSDKGDPLRVTLY